jgi:predicted MPP superfamily phosphohydrolase
VHVTAKGNRFLRLLLAIGIIVSGLLAYGTLVEPRFLIVNHITVPVVGISPDWNGATIVQLSDPHLGYAAPAAWRALDVVRRERSDLVVVTGDVADRRSVISNVMTWMARLTEAAGVPVIYVPGNHEHWRFDDEGGMKQFLDQLQQVGCIVLVNQSMRFVRRSGGVPLIVVGLDDSYSGYMDAGAAFVGLGQDEQAIVLEHCPTDARDIVSAGHASLVLTGHTHGGQVRLPLLGEWLASLVGESPLVSGMYSVAGVPVYVNRGLGMSVLPLRLFCLPEVTVFTLRGS